MFVFTFVSSVINSIYSKNYKLFLLIHELQMSKLQLGNDLINKLQKYKFTNDFFKLLITKITYLQFT